MLISISVGDRRQGGRQQGDRINDDAVTLIIDAVTLINLKAMPSISFVSSLQNFKYSQYLIQSLLKYFVTRRYCFF